MIFKSRLQRSVALSTTEAEYISAELAAREIAWIKQLFQKMRIPIKDTTLSIDNQSAIRLIENPVS